VLLESFDAEDLSGNGLVNVAEGRIQQRTPAWSRQRKYFNGTSSFGERRG
jgi:hypothetical protein